MEGTHEEAPETGAEPAPPTTTTLAHNPPTSPTPTPPPPCSPPPPATPSPSILSALSSVDAILSPSILSTLRLFLTQRGEPRVAIKLLTEHYEGRPEQINLLAHWLSLVPPHPSPSSTVTAAFHALVLQSFDAHMADRLFSSLPSTPPWLLRLLADDGWAEVFRQLVREHRGSLFLGFVERAMVGEGRGGTGKGGEGGGGQQVGLEEWERRVEDALVAAVEEAGTARTHARSAFLQLCGASECGYLYAQSLLSSLSSSLSALICRRLSEELSLHAATAHSSPLLFDFLLLHADRWPDAASALLAFYRAAAAVPAEDLAQPLLSSSLPSLTPADAVKLYTACASDSRPPSSLLHYAPLLSSLIHSLFLPHSPLPTHQVIYLLCYASTSPSSSSPSSLSLSSLISSLTSLISLLTSKSWALTPHLTLTHLRSSLSHPLLSSVALHFIHSHLTSPSYYDSTSATSLTPLLLSILAQLCSLNPLHHPAVFATITRTFSLPSSLDSLALITLRKQLLHLLLHLTLLGHLPALRWLRSQVHSLDHSLLRQFCMGLVGGVEGPMSLDMVEELLALLAEDEVRKGLKVMLAVLASEVGAAQRRRREAARPVPPEPAPAAEPVRKRLRRMEVEGEQEEGGAAVEAAPPLVEERRVGELGQRPAKTKAFLSEFALDGSGEEVEDVRALAVYLVDLHAALTAGEHRAELYQDHGRNDQADVVEHLDSFFALIEPHAALV